MLFHRSHYYSIFLLPTFSAICILVHILERCECAPSAANTVVRACTYPFRDSIQGSWSWIENPKRTYVILPTIVKKLTSFLLGILFHALSSKLAQNMRADLYAYMYTIYVLYCILNVRICTRTYVRCTTIVVYTNRFSFLFSCRDFHLSQTWRYVPTYIHKFEKIYHFLSMYTFNQRSLFYKVIKKLIE